MFLALLAAAIQPSPPAPPVVAIPAPPPLVRTSPPSLPRLQPVSVRFRLLASGRVLAEEQLRVGPTGADFRRSQGQGLGPGCPAFPGRRNESLSFNIGPHLGDMGQPATESRARIRLEWTRPPSDPCSAGTRTVELEDYAALVPGQTIVLEGDAGVRVEIAVAR